MADRGFGPACCSSSASSTRSRAVRHRSASASLTTTTQPRHHETETSETSTPHRPAYPSYPAYPSSPRTSSPLVSPSAYMHRATRTNDVARSTQLDDAETSDSSGDSYFPDGGNDYGFGSGTANGAYDPTIDDPVADFDLNAVSMASLLAAPGAKQPSSSSSAMLSHSMRVSRTRTQTETQGGESMPMQRPGLARQASSSCYITPQPPHLPRAGAPPRWRQRHLFRLGVCCCVLSLVPTLTTLFHHHHQQVVAPWWWSTLWAWLAWTPPAVSVSVGDLLARPMALPIEHQQVATLVLTLIGILCLLLDQAQWTRFSPAAAAEAAAMRRRLTTQATQTMSTPAYSSSVLAPVPTATPASVPASMPASAPAVMHGAPDLTVTAPSPPATVSESATAVADSAKDVAPSAPTRAPTPSPTRAPATFIAADGETATTAPDAEHYHAIRHVLSSIFSMTWDMGLPRSATAPSSRSGASRSGPGSPRAAGHGAATAAAGSTAFDADGAAEAHDALPGAAAGADLPMNDQAGGVDADADDDDPEIACSPAVAHQLGYPEIHETTRLRTLLRPDDYARYRDALMGPNDLHAPVWEASQPATAAATAAMSAMGVTDPSLAGATPSATGTSSTTTPSAAAAAMPAELKTERRHDHILHVHTRAGHRLVWRVLGARIVPSAPRSPADPASHSEHSHSSLPMAQNPFDALDADGVPQLHHQAAPEDPRSAFGIILDLTEAGRQESQLRAAEAVTRHVLDIVPCTIFALNDANDLVFLNRTGQRLFSIPPDRLQDYDLLDFVHPDDREAVAAARQRCSEHNETITLDTFRLHVPPDQRELWVALSFSRFTPPRLTADGHRTASSIASSSAAGSTSGSAASPLSNASSLSSTSPPPASLPPPPAGGHPASSWRRPPGAPAPHHHHHGLFEMADHGMVIGTIADVTDSHLAQSKLAENNQALDLAVQQAENAVAAKAAWVSTTSHEVRTPLGGILGLLGMLAETTMTDEQEELIAGIRDCSEGLLLIVNDILDFSRVESGKLQLEDWPFSIEQCLQNALYLLDIKASQKGLSLTYEIADGTPTMLLGDANRIRQIILNLAGNAVRFTDSGFITIRVRTKTPEDERRGLAARRRVEEAIAQANCDAQPSSAKPTTPGGLHGVPAGTPPPPPILPVGSQSTLPPAVAGRSGALAAPAPTLSAGSDGGASASSSSSSSSLAAAVDLAEQHATPLRLPPRRPAPPLSPQRAFTPSSAQTSPSPTSSTAVQGPLASSASATGSVRSHVKPFASSGSVSSEYPHAGDSHDTWHSHVALPSPDTPTAPVELLFEVADSGCGIPESAIPRLFQSFSQVDNSISRKYGGTGLGLAICKSLVEMMHGQIWVESEVGAGSTFFFTIRLAAFQTVPTTERSPEGKRAGGVASHRASTATAALAHGSGSLSADAATTPAGSIAAAAAAPSTGDPATARATMTDPVAPSTGFLATGARSTPTGSTAADGTTVPPQHVPRAQIKQLMDQRREERAKFGSRYPLRVLLAEDNQINTKLCVRFLQRLGLTCDLASNGLEAYQAAITRDYDIILMDVIMPSVSGLEASQMIRAYVPPERQPLIVALTANALEMDREKCFMSGMDAHVSKPIKAENMFRVLHILGREVMARRHYRAANPAHYRHMMPRYPPHESIEVRRRRWKRYCDDDDVSSSSSSGASDAVGSEIGINAAGADGLAAPAAVAAPSVGSAMASPLSSGAGSASQRSHTQRQRPPLHSLGTVDLPPRPASSTVSAATGSTAGSTTPSTRFTPHARLDAVWIELMGADFPSPVLDADAVDGPNGSALGGGGFIDANGAALSVVSPTGEPPREPPTFPVLSSSAPAPSAAHVVVPSAAATSAATMATPPTVSTVAAAAPSSTPIQLSPLQSFTPLSTPPAVAEADGSALPDATASFHAAAASSDVAGGPTKAVSHPTTMASVPRPPTAGSTGSVSRASDAVLAQNVAAAVIKDDKARFLDAAPDGITTPPL